jgi:hypothetical protein
MAATLDDVVTQLKRINKTLRKAYQDGTIDDNNET